ncbi:MAG: cupin domain-containing protein [Gemmataceae bacterium]|nr:cupin domain-containing protein [Gemmataceae bacterium]
MPDPSFPNNVPGPPLAGKELPTFRFALEASEPRAFEGGSLREQTVAGLPVATRIGAASLRLKAGGLRELHWHDAAEWALVLSGRMRTTIYHPDGAAEQNDFGPGDVWYFPPGHGHMLQNVGPGEAHSVLVFDDGNFAEAATFSSTAWLGKMPPAARAKSLGVSEQDLASLPGGRVFVAQGRVPPTEPEPFRKGPATRPALTNRFPLLSSEPHARYPGATEWRVTVNEFPIATRVCATVLELGPGVLREFHWHPHADEWQYVIAGTVRVGAVGPGEEAPSRVEELGTGDVGYVPRNFGHYLENAGDGPARVLVAFNSGEYRAVDLSDWLANNPASVVADNFRLPDAVVAKLPRRKRFVAGGSPAGSPPEGQD